MKQMIIDSNTLAFFELLRAGLWEKETQLSQNKGVDYAAILKIAEAQSVVGLITDGLEQVKDVKIPQVWTLQFIGAALQIEQRNKAMNVFVEQLTGKLREGDVYALLVKGQGVAQCYERPYWRACGDIDLLLTEENYKRAKEILIPLASTVDPEDKVAKHLALTIESWMVELHGSLHSGLTHRIDCVIDSVQNDVFYGGNVRSWMNGKTQVFLPGVDNDVIFIFTHILQHFFKGGIGLRQVCDWCRLLWTYRESLNNELLASRIRKAGLLTEWKAFAALAVDYLGMPVEAMLLYSPSKKWKRKAKKILDFILETGNFGHNRDKSYHSKYPLVVYKAISFWRNTWDSIRHFMIFPKDATIVWFVRLGDGVRAVLKKS